MRNCGKQIKHTPPNLLLILYLRYRQQEGKNNIFGKIIMVFTIFLRANHELNQHCERV